MSKAPSFKPEGLSSLPVRSGHCAALRCSPCAIGDPSGPAAAPPAIAIPTTRSSAPQQCALAVRPRAIVIVIVPREPEGQILTSHFSRFEKQSFRGLEMYKRTTDVTAPDRSRPLAFWLRPSEVPPFIGVILMSRGIRGCVTPSKV